MSTESYKGESMKDAKSSFPETHATSSLVWVKYDDFGSFTWYNFNLNTLTSVP